MEILDSVPQTVDPDLQSEVNQLYSENSQIEESAAASIESSADENIVQFEQNDAYLTEDAYYSSMEDLISVIDPYSVYGEVQYTTTASTMALVDDIPDYAVVYQVDGVDIYFPTSYSDDIIVSDGQLLNFGSNYTVGAQISGYSVSNYLSSEITIPTYHSSTWYQYLQTYGQPYRVVDRYVNTNGYISSSTRESVNLTFSGGNPWQGFTFDRIALFGLLGLLFILVFWRKSKL